MTTPVVIEARFRVDDETLDHFAERVARKQLEISGMTSGPPLSEPPGDPWSSEAPPPGSAPAARTEPPREPSAPTCVHGTRRYVKAGFSQRTQKPYAAFWGCAAPQGAPDKCGSVPA